MRQQQTIAKVRPQTGEKTSRERGLAKKRRPATVTHSLLRIAPAKGRRARRRQAWPQPRSASQRTRGRQMHRQAQPSGPPTVEVLAVLCLTLLDIVARLLLLLPKSARRRAAPGEGNGPRHARQQQEHDQQVNRSRATSYRSSSNHFTCAGGGTSKDSLRRHVWAMVKGFVPRSSGLFPDLFRRPTRPPRRPHGCLGETGLVAARSEIHRQGRKRTGASDSSRHRTPPCFALLRTSYLVNCQSCHVPAARPARRRSHSRIDSRTARSCRSRPGTGSSRCCRQTAASLRRRTSPSGLRAAS